MPTFRSWDDEDNDFDTRKNKRVNLYGRAVAKSKVIPLWNGKPVADMETDHIMNSILFCEKRFVDARSNFELCHNADEPMWIVNGEVPHSRNLNPNYKLFYFASVFEMFPDYNNLLAEWERRKV